MNSINNVNKYYNPNFSANFSNLEKRAMNEVKEYSALHSVETCKIIKKGKDITDRFDLFETADYVSVGPKNGNIFGINFGVFGRIFNFKRNIRNATYIHSHMTEVPLSRPDIIFAIKTKLKKIIAVSPSGKHSTLELEKDSKKLFEHFNVFDEPLNKYNELAQQDENVMQNKTLLKIYQDSVKKAWERFVELTNAKYSSNI